MKKCISTSLFDLFKAGPGPSSSHTIGPMRAAGKFIHDASQLPAAKLAAATRVAVELYGSLSSTGRGHGTHRAVAAGLLGQQPDTCDIALLNGLFDNVGDEYQAAIPGATARFSLDDIHFEDTAGNFRWQNTLRIKLLDGECVILEKTYYSIGGGFILCEGETEPEPPKPPHGYHDLNSFKSLAAASGLSVSEMLLENELAVSGLSKAEVNRKIDQLIEMMEMSVENGIKNVGVLPGSIGLQRKAKAFYERASRAEHIADRFMAMLNAFSLGASEENAAGHMVVTAPTSGSSGVIPGLIYFLKHCHHVANHKLREGLMVAGLIGFIARHNASISGAEVGCQGEVGVAAAMAAAMLAHINDCDLARIECAAEIALEHHLGMTCDPVGGYVQIPCIERNAVGAVTAYNAYLLSAMGDPKMQKVSFDEVIQAMLETGREMASDLKETSKGGLAACSLCR